MTSLPVVPGAIMESAASTEHGPRLSPGLLEELQPATHCVLPPATEGRWSGGW